MLNNLSGSITTYSSVYGITRKPSEQNNEKILVRLEKIFLNKSKNHAIYEIYLRNFHNKSMYSIVYRYFWENAEIAYRTLKRSAEGISNKVTEA